MPFSTSDRLDKYYAKIIAVVRTLELTDCRIKTALKAEFMITGLTDDSWADMMSMSNIVLALFLAQ